MGLNLKYRGLCTTGFHLQSQHQSLIWWMAFKSASISDARFLVAYVYMPVPVHFARIYHYAQPVRITTVISQHEYQ